jgi:hypothetical protein
MNESQDPKDPAMPRAPGPAAVEYQPPAIAWEEPLEAIAAASCAFLTNEPGCELHEFE